MHIHQVLPLNKEMGVCLTCTGALVPGDVVKGGSGGSPEGIPCTCQGGVSGGKKINGPERTERPRFGVNARSWPPTLIAL